MIWKYHFLEKKKKMCRIIAKTKNYSNYGIAPKVAVFHFQKIVFANFQTHRK